MTVDSNLDANSFGWILKATRRSPDTATGNIWKENKRRQGRGTEKENEISKLSSKNENNWKNCDSAFKLCTPL